jgi:uncharacterized protein YndB with AHSA1/START domain
MTEGVFNVSIAAPPEKVWTWVADLSKHPDWSPKTYTVEWLSGDPNEVGSRFRSVGWIPGDKDHENEGEITERTEPTRFALRSSDKQGSYQNGFDLAAGPDGSTDVTFTLRFVDMKGMATVMIPIAFPLIGKPDIRKRMQLLKGKVEGSD